MADTEVEQVDYEGEEENVVGDHPMETEDALPAPRLRSVVVGGDTSGTKKKGRGFRDAMDVDREDRGGQFESLDTEGGQGPQRSIEGWIILVTGIHEEAQEDDIHEAFAEYGEIKNLHLNFDRRTGFVKGYSLIEYEKLEEAEAAIQNMNGAEFLTQNIKVSWAFVKPPRGAKGGRRRR